MCASNEVTNVNCTPASCVFLAPHTGIHSTLHHRGTIASIEAITAATDIVTTRAVSPFPWQLAASHNDDAAGCCTMLVTCDASSNCCQPRLSEEKLTEYLKLIMLQMITTTCLLDAVMSPTYRPRSSCSFSVASLTALQTCFKLNTKTQITFLK